MLNNHTCNYFFVDCVLGGLICLQSLSWDHLGLGAAGVSNWWSDDLPGLWQRSQDLADPRFCVLGTPTARFCGLHIDLYSNATAQPENCSQIHVVWRIQMPEKPGHSMFARKWIAERKKYLATEKERLCCMLGSYPLLMSLVSLCFRGPPVHLQIASIALTPRVYIHTISGYIAQPRCHGKGSPLPTRECHVAQ